MEQRKMSEYTLVSSEHGFDDYSVEGISTVHRITVGHGIRKGDIFNVYCDDGRKIGGVWQGTLEKSLAQLAARLAAETSSERTLPESQASDVCHAYAVAFAYRCEPVDGSAPQASLNRGGGWVSLLASDEEEAMALVDRFFHSRNAIDSFEPAGRYRMLGHELAEAEEIPASVDHSRRHLYETKPGPRTFHFTKHGRGGQVVRHSESFETLERREKLAAIEPPKV